MSSRRVALVTGGSRGIGRGIVAELAGAGFDLAINYRSNEAAAEESRRLAMSRGAVEAILVAGDVASTESCRSMIDRVFEARGRLDLLVNNAGVAPLERLDVLETTQESWDRVVGTNLRGPFFLSQYAARRMIASGPAEEGARPAIVFITSVSSTFASTNRAEYCVSKAGMSMVVQLLACRLAEEGIGVFEVRPGIIATEMTAGVREQYERRIAEGLSPIRRWGNPGDVGRCVAALAGGAFGFTTGEVIHVDGGLNLRRL